MTLLSLSTKALSLMAIVYSANGFEVTGNGDSKFDEMDNQARRDLMNMFSRDVAGASSGGGSSKNIRAVRGNNGGSRRLMDGKGKKGTDAPIGECDALDIMLACEATVDGVTMDCNMLNDDVCLVDITYTITIENTNSAAPSLSSAPSPAPSMSIAPTAKKGKGKKDGTGKGKKDGNGKGKSATECTSDGSIILGEEGDLFIPVALPGLPADMCKLETGLMDLDGMVLAPGETEVVMFETTGFNICNCPEWFFTAAVSAVEGATDCGSSGKGKGKSGSDGTPCFARRSDANVVNLSPSAAPSAEPSVTASEAPSATPTLTLAPSFAPSSSPSAEPSASFAPTSKGKGKKGGGKGKKGNP
eukprot:CAMPEP_0113470682 /NCGR_PEP_ID=MMETSP0014_2-20120614/16574_1 /TAXON_ID=2857 /ORGANISM="Nitzschia sp." /LENGTH=358 /DNA_ID=CAMNT_0000363265 /DNA_START=835 /DNA_END=1911 /DNA_ORIENTATION=+ /assembly_acc=CAM_ASM_000159